MVMFWNKMPYMSPGPRLLTSGLEYGSIPKND